MTSCAENRVDCATERPRRRRRGSIAAACLALFLLAPSLAAAAPGFVVDRSFLPYKLGTTVNGPIALGRGAVLVATYSAEEGRRYVTEYRLIDTEWETVSVTFPPAYGVPGLDNGYGVSLATDGTTRLIGYPSFDGNQVDRVLVRVGYGTQEVEGVLTPSDAGPNQHFGAALDVDQDVLVVGAPSHDGAGEDAGAVYVFALVDGTWSEVARLTAPDAAPFQHFGHTVSVSGTSLAVGTPDGTGVYVYTNAGSGWVLQQQVVLDASRQHWAEHIVLDGDTLATAGQDGVDIFVRNAGAWAHAQRVITPASPSEVGYQVGLSGNLLVVTAPDGEGNAFERSAGSFAQTSLVRYPLGGPLAVTVDNDRILFAGLRSTNPGFTGAELFVRDPYTETCGFLTGGDVDGDALCTNEVLYLSATASATLGGTVFADEDIVRYEERRGTYSLFFDGSDVGLAGQDVDAFSIRPDGSILLSFDADFTLAGMGTVFKQDIVRFVPTSTGEATAGTFEPFFRGRDHGLTASNANITGLYEAADGRLFLSFGTHTYFTNLEVSTEDIVRFNPGTNDYTMVFDGSDLGLGPYSIGSFNFKRDGSLVLSLTAYPTGSGLPPGLPAGTKHDAFAFIPTQFPASYGPQTSGTFRPYLVGARNGLPSTLQLDGIFSERLEVTPSVYQAESALIGGTSIVESTNAGYVGAAYINSSTTGGSIEFENVNGGSGGTKVLRFRNALGVSGSRTGRLVVNGAPQNATFRSTSAWTNWTETDFPVLLDSSETNTIRLESTGQDLANIDQLQVVTLYHAEAASIGGGSVAETVNAGFSGTGYVNSSVAAGTIQFDEVDGDLGGEKMLRIRFALGVSTPRTGRLVINNQTRNVTFQPTGSWTTWTTLDVPVVLRSGTRNTIRFETTGFDLANIDLIEIQ